MGSSAGSTGKSKEHQILVYAPYVEEKHKNFLATVAEQSRGTASGTPLVDDSPFADYDYLDIEDIFIGVGLTVNDFASMFDMFGKFMAGLDIEVLWDTAFENTLISPYVDTLATAESALIDDTMDGGALASMQLRMRDLNAVTSSTFIIETANLEAEKLKSVSAYTSNLRASLIQDAVAASSTHLQWNTAVIDRYARLTKQYFSTKLDTDRFNDNIRIQDRLWPFTVLDWERSALGALQGAKSAKSSFKPPKQDKLAGAISGAITGASAGASFGGIGAVVGGVVGAAMSFF